MADCGYSPIVAKQANREPRRWIPWDSDEARKACAVDLANAAARWAFVARSDGRPASENVARVLLALSHALDADDKVELKRLADGVRPTDRYRAVEPRCAALDDLVITVDWAARELRGKHADQDSWALALAGTILGGFEFGPLSHEIQRHSSTVLEWSKRPTVQRVVADALMARTLTDAEDAIRRAFVALGYPQKDAKNLFSYRNKHAKRGPATEG